jgi:carboxymethylenebutenolidase
MSSSWENVRTDGSNMRVYTAVPEGAQKVPAIVVVQGQTGVNDFVKFSDMVTTYGIAAAAPDLYHRDPPDCKDDAPTRRMRLRDAAVIQDIDATVNFLKSHKSVDPNAIGIVGFCMGGRIVYLMSAANPDIKAGVMYYGGDTFSAWGQGRSPFERSDEI